MSQQYDPEVLEQESEFVGTPMAFVPSAPVTESDCNGKRWEDRDSENRKLFAGYCDLSPGFGTEHNGEGRCKFHGGAGQDSPDTGAPESNQNASTHSLTADPHHYHESLSHEESEFVLDAAAAIEDRIRASSGNVDFLDRILARRIAIRLHIVAQASDYTGNVVGLTETIFTEDGAFDQKTPLVDEIRQYDNSIVQDLKKLGALNDPESQKADAVSEWREFVEANSE